MPKAVESTDVAVFSQDELRRIHHAACAQVQCAVENRYCDTRTLLGDLADREVAGVYISLKRGETLRGCCGMQGPPIQLADAIADAATRTARHDPRMTPIAAVELPHLSLATSIIGPPRPIGVQGDDRISAVEVGRHGLRIRMAGKAGLLLPSVARERQWTARQFLDAICTKAGLPPGSWRSDQASVEVFEGIDYGESFQCVTLGSAASNETEPSALRVTSDGNGPDDSNDPAAIPASDLDRLVQWTEENLAAIRQGATPFYYASDVQDGSVQGIVLRVFYQPGAPPASFLQLTIREQLPLQSTLFQMTQHAATSLLADADGGPWKAEIGILSTLVHHGSGVDCDLAGVDRRRRAILALEGSRWAVSFDQSAEPHESLQRVLAAQPFRRESTMIYSARCDASETQFTISMGTRAQPRTTARPPAVAGMFYPADDQDREALIDELLQGFAAVNQTKVAAAMVPHAGLHYSGRIAVDVWRRIKLPQSVLIIGPKHTADGVDWAVAPHDRWQISTQASISGDMELAQRIADTVPGMQLDAAAHAREHGIEVQLPLLYRLAPDVRVAAIAMSTATMRELDEAAQALAQLLGSLDEPPLLVISSDMNHFADDAENRRRDRIALHALEQADPVQLLRQCEAENISMCGKIPAALVLLTLQAMGQKANYRQIGYATSGDVSGDRSRVVGYAGVLF